MTIAPAAHGVSPRHGHAALAAVAAVSVFSATALWLQWARRDLDWVQATLSLYLHGPGGLALRSAYCVLAVAIMLLAWSLYAGSRSPRRSSAAPLLFCVAGLGLMGVAIGDSWLPALAPLVAPLVHGLAANTAFLCVSAAMLLQSWYLRADPQWSRWAAPAWWWAWGCFVLLWLHVLWRGPPRGAGQKLVIAAVVVWLLGVALCQWRHARRRAG
ncbi:DUF998 domain-containing protein [Stenotrophomonas rhizophila]|uniref:DUF998 domain-containing protein n=1 Tax=Stenotrophomonas rhizophila TaxID=216778 RepID=UPI0028D726A2|nr:DUF998 domain-containing protein [Stenotrophomonas rhizophila]